MIKLLKGISALEKDRDLGFSRGHQGIGINDDDNNKEDNGNDINNDDKLWIVLFASQWTVRSSGRLPTV